MMMMIMIIIIFLWFWNAAWCSLWFSATAAYLLQHRMFIFLAAYIWVMTCKPKIFAQVILLLASVLFLIGCAMNSYFSGKQLHFNKKGATPHFWYEIPRNVNANVRPIARGLLSRVRCIEITNFWYTLKSCFDRITKSWGKENSSLSSDT